MLFFSLLKEKEHASSGSTSSNKASTDAGCSTAATPKHLLGDVARSMTGKQLIIMRCNTSPLNCTVLLYTTAQIGLLRHNLQAGVLNV
jgi:hypothetical protein